MPRSCLAARKRCGWLLATILLAACPKQDLAPLNPCTVSGVSEQINQAGLSQVDLLFVIDDSGSMATEQLKLAEELPRLVRVLTSGDRFAGRAVPAGVSDEERFFTKVKSLHLGVVSTNMGGLEKPEGQAPKSCSGVGDDGKLLRSTSIALNGVVAQTDTQFDGFRKGETVIAGDPACAISTPPAYQEYDFAREDDPTKVAQTFSCVSRLGVTGCPFEQPLEAMWKALAPSDGKGEQFAFLDGRGGHGDGANAGFLRAEALLAVIHVSDEEDCSIKPDASLLFQDNAEADERFGNRAAINVRCQRFGTSEGLVWPARRYIDGLRSLKPGHEDRIVFASIVGIPEALNGSNDLDAMLDDEAMQFGEVMVSTSVLPRSSCTRERNGKLEQATPPRRFVEVAKGFQDAQVIWSICSEDYAPALDRLIDRIASKLKGNCLPRQLKRAADGRVECQLYELLADSVDTCATERGHSGKPEERSYRDANGKLTKRNACLMKQVPVLDRAPAERGIGWYYDDFAQDLASECGVGGAQRISFKFQNGEVDLPEGAGALYECFQSVTPVETGATGVLAVHSSCKELDGKPSCADKSDGDEGGYDLTCVEGRCQIPCEVDPDCPAGWVCGDAPGDGEPYCQQPTCPQRYE